MAFDKFNDECAVVGIVGVPEAANYAYLSLYAMQHRGQEGAGIVTSDTESFYSHKNTGLVADVFPPEAVEELHGQIAIGHTRYATFGNKDHLENLQPLIANVAQRPYAIAHNGNLINAGELRADLESRGAIFSSTSDTEVILHLIAHSKEGHILERTADAISHVKGAFSLVVLTLKGLIAVRDPSGVRPLSLGKKDGGYVVASETCAFDLIGAEFVRDIEPGEILDISIDGTLKSAHLEQKAKRSFCVFEYVYFSRPDSSVEGRNVYGVRKCLGRELAKEHPAAGADLVVPVPDSGVPAAMGFAEESGLRLEFGLIRNHYVGRTFIEPKQEIRDFGVKIKLNANADIIAGKKVVLVDDSIVRGTTSRKIVKMVREAGATEVHVRVSSPPTVAPCHYGIDTPSEDELIAANNKVDGICKYIGADSLGYLSTEGMFRAVGDKQANFCDACFTNDYPLGKIVGENGRSRVLKVISG